MKKEEDRGVEISIRKSFITLNKKFLNSLTRQYNKKKTYLNTREFIIKKRQRIIIIIIDGSVLQIMIKASKIQLNIVQFTEKIDNIIKLYVKS